MPAQTKKLTHEIELRFASGFQIVLEAESVTVPDIGESVSYGEETGKVKSRSFRYSADSGLDPVACRVALDIG